MPVRVSREDIPSGGAPRTEKLTEKEAARRLGGALTYELARFGSLVIDRGVRHLKTCHSSC